MELREKNKFSDWYELDKVAFTLVIAGNEWVGSNPQDPYGVCHWKVSIKLCTD